MEPKIIFEDEYILVIDKPYGVVVNRSETQKAGDTVQDWIFKREGGSFSTGFTPKGETRIPEEKEEEEYDKTKEFYERGGIVHRLDKDTSGVLLIAKTPEVFADLQKQFKARKVVKEYVALVHGDVAGFTLKGETRIQRKIVSNIRASRFEFIVDAPLGRNPRNRMKWAIVEGGKGAITIFNFKFLIFNKYGNFSFLECRPKTGRTHQIRVHLAALGFPIVSDPLYLGRKHLTMDLDWCPRMFLHATKLGITHSVSGEKMSFASLLPEELKMLLEI